MKNPTFDTAEEYDAAIDRCTKGLHALSVGACCEGCDECTPADEEGHFSRSGCDICGSPLGGTLYPAHALLDSDNTLIHLECCEDCLIYIANGDLPEHTSTKGGPNA